jgi:WhiB family redox-sensing transcriptional regulator
MAPPQRNWLPTGCEQVFPHGMEPVRETRTTSMRRVLRSTGTWQSAEPYTHYDDQWVPTEEIDQPFHWKWFVDWHESSKCRSLSVKEADEMFFGESEDDTKTSLTIIKIREVKAFCKTCPVFVECLTHSLSTPERHGIWAGTSKRTRLRILALIEQGETSILQVVDDYLNGREKKYESIRRPRA